MKKLVMFLFTITICISLTACSFKNGAEIEREMIPISTLIADLDNLARAEQNVGKATHLFGAISYIGTEEFTLNHLFVGKSFSIPMDSAKLAELNKGDYIAIYAVVDEINDGDFKFKYCKQIETKLMDEYVVNMVSGTSTEVLIEKYSTDIEDYVVSRGDTFKMASDSEIASYILGKWYRPAHVGFEIVAADFEYYADGDCDWSFWDADHKIWRSYWCTWSVKDGIFSGLSSEKTAVYKITDNAMVTGGDLCIRAN